MDRRPHETAKRNASLAIVASMVLQLNALGLVLDALAKKHGKALRALETFLDINDEVLNPTPAQRVWNYAILIGFLMVWLLDTVVFGPAAAHLVRRAIPHIPILSPIVGFVAAVLAPLALISIEALLGSVAHKYGDRHSPDFHRGKQVAAICAGLCVATAATVMVVSLDLAGNEAKGGSDDELSYHQWSLYSLAAITLLLHGTILILADKGATAKEFAAAQFKRWKLAKPVAALREALAKKRTEFVKLGTAYIQAVFTLVQTYGEPVPWGPFCEEALEQFRRHFPHLRIAAGSLPASPDAALREGEGPTARKTQDDDVIDVDPEHAN